MSIPYSTTAVARAYTERMPESDLNPAHSGVKLTYDDYVLFPEDGLRHELIDGEHYVSPAPLWNHQAICSNIHGLIWSHLQTDPIGRVFFAPFDVILSRYDVVEPDIVYISRQRMAEVETSPYLKGAPNLVVEVASPATRKRDQTIKRRLYEQFGIDEYWLADPVRRSIRVFRLDEGKYQRAADLSAGAGDVLTTPLLPGLSMPLAKVFED
jgi:Uma2 family endonuclease